MLIRFMKRNSLILGFLVLMTFVGCGESISTPSFEHNLILKLENFYIDRQFKVEVNHGEETNTYFIDGKSFYHLQSDTSVFKYTFLDNYMMYKGNELLDENYKLEYDISEEFIALVNPLKINENQFEKIDETYHLINFEDGNYKIPLIDKNVTSLIISFVDGYIKYEYELDDETNCILKFKESEYKVCYYTKVESDYVNYYKNYKISYDELKSKIKNKEYFGLILTYKTCASCMRAQGLYYEFFLEYNTSMFYTLATDELTKEESKELNKIVADAYNKQDDEFKHENFPSYPDSFLTPSACYFKEGNITNVLPGFIVTMAQLLYKMII